MPDALRPPPNSLSQGDRKSFIFFIILVALTAGQFLTTSQTPMIIGFLSIVWGGFGIFRLIYLTHYQMDEVPKVFILPVQIIFGTGVKEQERRKLIVKRLTRPDFILWLASSIGFMLWAIINGLYPNGIYLHEAFKQIEPITGINLPLTYKVDPHAILNNLSFFGAVITLIFVAVTFSYKRSYLKAALFVLTPLILIGLYGIMTGRYAETLLWPDLTYFRGAGLRDQQAEFLMGSLKIFHSGTPFLNRFLELGSIGAYVPYLIGLPALMVFIKTIYNSNRHKAKPIIGVLLLTLLASIDIFIIASVWTSYSSTLIVCAIAMLWGHMVRYKL